MAPIPYSIIYKQIKHHIPRTIRTKTDDLSYSFAITRVSADTIRWLAAV